MGIQITRQLGCMDTPNRTGMQCRIRVGHRHGTDTARTRARHVSGIKKNKKEIKTLDTRVGHGSWRVRSVSDTRE